jgi:hypothetical protein
MSGRAPLVRRVYSSLRLSSSVAPPEAASRLSATRPPRLRARTGGAPTKGLVEPVKVSGDAIEAVVGTVAVYAPQIVWRAEKPPRRRGCTQVHLVGEDHIGSVVVVHGSDCAGSWRTQSDDRVAIGGHALGVAFVLHRRIDPPTCRSGPYHATGHRTLAVEVRRGESVW